MGEVPLDFCQITWLALAGLSGTQLGIHGLCRSGITLLESAELSLVFEQRANMSWSRCCQRPYQCVLKQEHQPKRGTNSNQQKRHPYWFLCSQRVLPKRVGFKVTWGFFLCHLTEATRSPSSRLNHPNSKREAEREDKSRQRRKK